jgi:hypothetical protein
MIIAGPCAVPDTRAATTALPREFAEPSAHYRVKATFRPKAGARAYWLPTKEALQLRRFTLFGEPS